MKTKGFIQKICVMKKKMIVSLELTNFRSQGRHSNLSPILKLLQSARLNLGSTLLFTKCPPQWQHSCMTELFLTKAVHMYLEPTGLVWFFSASQNTARKITDDFMKIVQL